jgi:phage shock protein C
MEKKLYRDEHNKTIAGVCAGLAEYLNVDISVVRAIFLIALVLKGVGFIPYIVLWIVLPKKPYFTDPKVDYTVPPQPFNPFSGVPPVQPMPPFAMPPKKRSSAGLIVGIALVVFGSFFLLDEFNVLPDLDIERLWPIAFIVAGIIVVFSGRKKPWEEADWHKTDKKEDDAPAEDKPADDTPTV